MESLNFERPQNLLDLDNDVTRKGSRRKREFIPDDQKDALYWEKRRKNNEAAKKSREKRRMNDYVLETYVMALKEENTRLKAELMAIKIHFGLAHPAAYTAYQLSHMQDQARNSAHARGPHLTLQMDYWRSQESPVWSSSQHPHPVFMPIPQTRANPYSNQHGGTNSSLSTTFIYPEMFKQSQPHQPDVVHMPRRPSPRKDLWEEDEQQVPRISQLPGPMQTPKHNPDRDRRYLLS
ncbi:nuclear factor interleukin-3-regulated protein-like [Periophthalmus magnuspinnatus]|uniref:nuclear factor interleukin-3-regulated protein-like n=1 Tax=Periophthalmus magnuspinnatus TaxID=409849 RepID=UPI00145A6A3A|nr:nuclear factor interleukin-3-regulated protein-like [Periophthalmus magnuspinnatus]